MRFSVSGDLMIVPLAGHYIIPCWNVEAKAIIEKA